MTSLPELASSLISASASRISGHAGNDGKDAAGADDSDDSDLEILGEPPKMDSGKRKRDAGVDADGPQPKKRAQDGSGGAGPIRID